MKKMSTNLGVLACIVSLTSGSIATAEPDVCLDTSGDRLRDCPAFLRYDGGAVCTVLSQGSRSYAYECTDAEDDWSATGCSDMYCTMSTPSTGIGDGSCSGSYFRDQACNDDHESVLLELEIFELVNQARADHGLGPLAYDPIVSNIAEEYGTDYICAERCDSYTPENCHRLDGNNIGNRLVNGGLRYLAAAENLHYSNAPPEYIVHGGRYGRTNVTGWMQSPGHRDNILDASGKGYTHIGVAHVACPGTDKWIINLVKYPSTLSLRPILIRPWHFGAR